MENYLIGGLICIIAILIVGVELLQRLLNESINKGRLKGVENCRAYSNSELVSEEAVKATCVSTFQKYL